MSSLTKRALMISGILMMLGILSGQSLCPCIVIPDIEGTYEPLTDTRCEIDQNNPTLNMLQNCHILVLTGGFAEANGEEYYGRVSKDGVVNLLIGAGNCSGVVLSGVFTGTCTFPERTCAFAFCQTAECPEE